MGQAIAYCNQCGKRLTDDDMPEELDQTQHYVCRMCAGTMIGPIIPIPAPPQKGRKAAGPKAATAKTPVPKAPAATARPARPLTAQRPAVKPAPAPAPGSSRDRILIVIVSLIAVAAIAAGAILLLRD